mgnify:FL=1
MIVPCWGAKGPGFFPAQGLFPIFAIVTEVVDRETEDAAWTEINCPFYNNGEKLCIRNMGKRPFREMPRCALL